MPGVYQPCTYLCDWMKNISDDTLLTSMNFPGTHDTATVSDFRPKLPKLIKGQWNYTQATQDRFDYLTVNDIGPAISYQSISFALTASASTDLCVDVRTRVSPQL